MGKLSVLLFISAVCLIALSQASPAGNPLNIVFFSKNSRKFATSPSPAFGCYWLYKKIQPIGGSVHSLR